ncbi:MAG: hypothetical protein AAF772_00395 [Acidobacteriota bacterium]
MNQRAYLATKERADLASMLRKNGVPVERIWDLQDRPDDLELAAPLLFSKLPELRSHGARCDAMMIIRKSQIDPLLLIGEMKRVRPQIESDHKLPHNFSALTIKEQDRLRAEHFEKFNGYAEYGWHIGEAIRIRMNPAVYDQTTLILKDPRYSIARRMLPEALVKIKSKRQETVELLCSLIDDPDITPNVIETLARAKATETIPLIQPCTESPIPLVKREAQKAIKKLEKLRDKQIKPTKPPALTEVTSGPPDGLIESSMNFDAEQIPAFLGKVFKQLQNVDRRVASEVRDVLLTMEIDEERAFTFEVTLNDRLSSVYLRLFMDDEDAADLALYAEPDIAAIIDQVMEASMMR